MFLLKVQAAFLQLFHYEQVYLQMIWSIYCSQFSVYVLPQTKPFLSSTATFAECFEQYCSTNNLEW